MGIIGTVAKAILITWVVFWVSAIFYYFASGQLAFGTLFLVGLLIPSTIIVYEYRKYKRSS